MSKEDLKRQIRALANELQLSTYINKGAISESSDLKVRVADLERQNTALRAAESRLTATEEKLEDREEEIQEKEAQIKRLREAVCGLRESLRNMTRQRDTWTRRWDRMVDMIKKEEADLEEESDTEPATDFPTMSSIHEKVVNNPPVRSDAHQRASPPSDPTRDELDFDTSLGFRHEEANGPSKAASGSRQSLHKKRRRRIGDESSSDDEPYKPYKPASSDQTVCRPRSVRDRKKPAIQLSVVKLETPTPEPEPELPDAPSKSARRRKKNKRDEGAESDDSDDALGQW